MGGKQKVRIEIVRRTSPEDALLAPELGLRECGGRDRAFETIGSGPGLLVRAFVHRRASLVQDPEASLDVPWQYVRAGQIIQPGSGEHQFFGIVWRRRCRTRLTMDDESARQKCSYRKNATDNQSRVEHADKSTMQITAERVAAVCMIGTVSNQICTGSSRIKGCARAFQCAKIG